MENAFWFVIGSLLTVITTKFLEMYQTSRSHKYTLKKIYFEKKISAAEEAVTDLYQEVNGIRKFIRLYHFHPKVFHYRITLFEN
jgi:CII-binding regulator of phage lambda lysogenization HflD